jgi:hypothetical protein
MTLVINQELKKLENILSAANKDNWNEDGYKKIEDSVGNKAREIISNLNPNLPMPIITPSKNGELSIAWSNQVDRAVELIIDNTDLVTLLTHDFKNDIFKEYIYPDNFIDVFVSVPNLIFGEYTNSYIVSILPSFGPDCLEFYFIGV